MNQKRTKESGKENKQRGKQSYWVIKGRGKKKVGMMEDVVGGEGIGDKKVRGTKGKKGGREGEETQKIEEN